MFTDLANNIHAYLFLSALFFVFGIITMTTRRNAIGLLMGVELVLNAAALNFVAFQAFKGLTSESPYLDGHVFSLFIIVIAAIEAAVAFAIVIRMFTAKKNIDPELATELKG